MKNRLSVRRSSSLKAFRAGTKAPREARKTVPSAILWLVAITLGILSMTEVYDALAKSAAAQGGGSCGPAFTVVDVSAAATGMMQGTGATSINAGGDIAGVYVTAPSASVPNLAHGFVRTAATGAITTFDSTSAGTGKNQGTFAVSINDSGVIAGVSTDANNAEHGFMRAADGTITEFDVPGAPTSVGHRGTSPISINNSGVIAGMYETADTVRHGFVRAANGTITTFDVPGAGTGLTTGTIPLRISVGGDITGFYLDSNHLSHAFIRAANGTITAPIDAPGAGTVGSSKGFKFGGTIAVGIDTAGDIAGIYADTNSVFHGYVRAANGTITTFDVTGAGTTGLFPGTLPTSMNPGGDIAGFYADTNGANHAFVRNFGTGAITAPLDASNAAKSGMFNGTVPFGINASDDLAGTYIDAGVVFHGFVFGSTGTAATPTFSPPAGTYSSTQMVTISDTTAGTSIYYTTDNTTPTTSSTLYTGPITVSSTETIQAIAAASGCSNSAVATANYVIAPPAPTPTFSPAAGTYTSVQSVTISDATAGATIYYTTNNTTPTTSSTVFSGPIPVSSTETIQAIAAATGFSNSAVASATYTINLPAAPTPTFSPAAGNYTSTQMVTISDTAAGASIYYTTNNTTPTTSSTLFSGPITVSSTETIQAIAAATGFSNSAVASATYTFPTPDFQLSVNPTTLTIKAGQTGTATFTVTPVNGFNSSVSFACNGLPSESTCAFSPASVTPNGTAAATSTLTVSTTAKGGAIRLLWPHSPRPIYTVLYFVLAMLLAFAARFRRPQNGLRVAFLWLFLLAVAGLTSCNGGSYANPGTPLGTTVVTVGASSGGGGGLNHSANLTITITQ